MKIAVLSFFDSHNIGDVLIASQINKIFSSLKNCVFFDIGSGKSYSECELKKNICDTKKKSAKQKILKIPFICDLIYTVTSLKSKNYKNIIMACNDCDTVIFAGGNQIMELNRLPSGIISFYRTVKNLKESGKKIHFCFCGVGPFKSSLSKTIAKKIFLLADFISVRDEYSLGWIKKLLPNKKAEIWCDPVLLLNSDFNNVQKNNAIGVNVYFGYDTKYKNKMKNAYVRIIEKLRKRLTDIDIYLFSSELTDINDINIVKKSFSDDSRVVVKNIKSVEELFDLYSQIDLVMAARMHTAITATVSGIPVLTVSWQEKVKSFMSLMKNKELNFDIKAFTESTELVIEKIISVVEDKENLVKKNKKTLLELRKQTQEKLQPYITCLEE